MNKKIARKRKKLLNQVRDHRVLPNGRILAHNGCETLLGNLNPVKHIPMLPWKHIIAFPTMTNKISVATEGKNAWFYNMLEKSTHQAHDLIGFTPVKTLDSTTFDQAGVGSVGMAMQVIKIDPPENGRATVHLKGICRYENIGFLDSTEDHFNIKVRWFEDDREKDAMVKPEVERCLKIFRTIVETLNNAGIEGFNNRSPVNLYDFTKAQYLSFSLIEGTQTHFDEEEKRELLLLRSTSKRFKILNEYFERLLAEVERRFKNRSQI
jgi:Lon protease-like protein